MSARPSVAGGDTSEATDEINLTDASGGAFREAITLRISTKLPVLRLDLDS